MSPGTCVGVDPRNAQAARLYERLHYRDWRNGEVDTVREVYLHDGRLTAVPDRCRIFVKDIAW